MEENETPFPLFTVRSARLPSPPVDNYTSHFDISRKNILALVTNAPLLSVQGHASFARNGSQSLFNGALNDDRRGVKRTADDEAKIGKNDGQNHHDHDEHLETGERSTENGLDDQGAVSTVFLCDLDNVWRPFEVFQFSGHPSVVKWSNCASKILVCSDLGIFYILTSKTGTLNSWHVLHRGGLGSEEKVIHVAWLKQLIHFSSESEPQLDGLLEDREKALSWTAVSTNQDSEDYLDGFFCVTKGGKIVFVTVHGKTLRTGKTKCSVTSTEIAGKFQDFSMADSVFDPDDHRFILVLGHPELSDIVCLKIGLSEGNVSPLRSPTAVVENLVNVPLKRKISCLSWLNCGGQKDHYLAVATIADEDGATLEVWALSREIQDDFLLSLEAEIIEPSSVKLFWNCLAEKQLPAEIITMAQSVQFFRSADLPRQGAMAVQFATGEFGLLSVKIDVEISFSGPILLHAPKPTSASLFFSSNGFVLLHCTEDCRITAWRMPQEFWPFSVADDATRLLLNTSGDLCDFIAVLEGLDSSVQLELLENSYRAMTPNHKLNSRLRYYRLKAGLTEKMYGKEAGFVVLLTVYYDSFLSYLEQFLAPHDAVLTSVFQISELLSILERADATLDAVVSVVDRHVALEKAAIGHVQTGFHQIFVVMFHFVTLCVRHQHVLISASEALAKVRLIVAILAAWTGSHGFFKQLWRRPPLYPAKLDFMEVLFSATGLLISEASDTQVYGDLLRVLEEIDVEDDSFGRNWMDLYLWSESRVSTAGQVDSLRYLFNTRFPYTPAQHDVRKGKNEEKTEGQPDNTVRRPGRRKFCSRCCFNFPWRPTMSYAGSWTSHIQHRWIECFCGGQWIFLE